MPSWVLQSHGLQIIYSAYSQTCLPIVPKKTLKSLCERSQASEPSPFGHGAFGVVVPALGSATFSAVLGSATARAGTAPAALELAGSSGLLGTVTGGLPGRGENTALCSGGEIGSGKPIGLPCKSCNNVSVPSWRCSSASCAVASPGHPLAGTQELCKQALQGLQAQVLWQGLAWWQSFSAHQLWQGHHSDEPAAHLLALHHNAGSSLHLLHWSPNPYKVAPEGHNHAFMCFLFFWINPLLHVIRFFRKVRQSWRYILQGVAQSIIYTEEPTKPQSPQPKGTTQKTRAKGHQNLQMDILQLPHAPQGSSHLPRPDRWSKQISKYKVNWLIYSPTKEWSNLWGISSHSTTPTSFLDMFVNTGNLRANQ